MSDLASLKQRSLASLKWSAVGEILSRVLQPLLILVVGALISPSEFGLLGIATIVLGVGQLLQDMGLGKTLIQRETDVDISASQIFWINVALSVLLYILACAGAPLIGSFFSAPSSVNIVRILSLRLVITALGTVQLTLLQRGLQFRAVFISRFAGALAACAITIPLAFGGHGVWSLVWGMLAAASTQTACLWLLSEWRPQWRWEQHILLSLISFSKWVLVESVLAAAIQWGDSAIVGHYLGTEALGKYRMASNWMAFLSGLIFAPLMPVAFSWLSRLQANRDEFSNVLGKLTRMATLLAFPIGFGLAATAQPLVEVILGDKWVGTEWVLAALGVKLALDWTVGFNAGAYTAMGRPDVNVKLLSAICLVSLPAFLISAPFGLGVFAMVRLMGAVADVALNLIVGSRILSRGFRALAKCLWPALPAAAGMVVAVFGVEVIYGMRVSGLLATQIVIGCVVYTGIALILEPQLLRAAILPLIRSRGTQ